jgi:beta-barrel assembly-enhancing protease
VQAHEINGQVLHESLPRGASACSLALAGRMLVARLRNGDVMKLDIRQVEIHRGGAGGSQFVYTSTLMGGPTFVTDDVELQRAVSAALPRGHERRQVGAASPGRRRLSGFQKVALTVVASLLGLVVLAVILVGPLVHLTLRFVPRTVDNGIGTKAFPHVLRQIGMGTPAIEQASIREPVQTVLDRLTAAVPNNPFFFRVAICRSPMVNAFALPGGQIVVTTGMLAMLESGDELAGVLAHEMNHVLFRHTMEMTIRASGLRFLVYALSQDHPLVGMTTSVWSAVGLMSMSRDKETQADREAVRLLASASIDPKAMVPPFKRLQTEEAKVMAAMKAEDRKLFERLSSHPEMGKRIADMEAAAASAPALAAAQPMDIDYAALVKAVQALEAEPLPERAPASILDL